MGSRQDKPRGTRRRTATLVLTGALVGAVLAGPAIASAGSGYGPIWKFVKSKLSAAGTLNKPNNPVDFTRLKNVPAGFADGVDDVGSLGTFTVRTSFDIVPGGVAHNGKYGLEDVVKYCDAGEIAVSGSAYYDVDLNGAGAGGSDDMELTIASLRRVTNGDLTGYLAWGGNDSGADRVFTVQVLCLAQ